MLITCYHHVGEPPASAPHQRTWVSQQHLAAQVELLASRGWEIGSHADQHVRLAGQPEETQRASLEASRERLEHLTGRPPRSLAYPYASYDEGTLVAAKALGFTSAVRLGGGLNDERTDALQLNRVGLCGHRWWERLERLKLACTLRGWYPRRRPPSLVAPT